MRRKIKKLVSLLICAAMIIAITAVASFALPSVPNCLNPIKIDSSTDSIDNLSSQGWSWNKSTHTLTIDGMYQQFNEDGENSIDFGESNTDINIVIKNNNKIYCHCSSTFVLSTKGNITINGGGTLDIDNSYNYSYDGFYISKSKSLNVSDVSISMVYSSPEYFSESLPGDGIFLVNKTESVAFNNVTLYEDSYSDIICLYGKDLNNTGNVSITDCNFSEKHAFGTITIQHFGNVNIDNTVIDATTKVEYYGLSISNVKNFTVSNSKIYCYSCYFYDTDVNIINSVLVANDPFDSDDSATIFSGSYGIELEDSNLYAKYSYITASGCIGGIYSRRNYFDNYLNSLEPGSNDYNNYFDNLNKVKNDCDFLNPIINFDNCDISITCAEGFLPISFEFRRYLYYEDNDFNIEDYNLNPILILNNIKCISGGSSVTGPLYCITDNFYNSSVATSNNNMAVYGITSNGLAPLYDFDNLNFKNGIINSVYLAKGIFELNGGKLVDSATVSGSIINKTAGTPVKSGFTFGGWYYDKELTKPVKDGDTYKIGTVLYAKWIAATGDTTEIGAIAAIGVFSILGIGIVIKKRR